jgi:putative ATP-dependent endonuclease of OLD family
VLLTAAGTAVTQPALPAQIAGVTARTIADLERYLDATRSTMLYARKVLLVEGPAELFVIPPLAQDVLGLDLDAAGIAVVPIFGTHFGAYASLFAVGGIQRKCAIVTDGDLTPSDADAGQPLDGEDPAPTYARQDLDAFVSDNLRVFMSDTTFERELTVAGNLTMLEAAAREIGAVRTANAIQAANVAGAVPAPMLIRLKDRILRTAKTFGKARFAQTVSKHTALATAVPPYIEEALLWLTDDAANH